MTSKNAGEFVSIQEWASRRAHGAGRDGETEVSSAATLPDCFVRKQTDAVGKEFGRDFAAPAHHFFGRHGEAKCLFVKLDREL